MSKQPQDETKVSLLESGWISHGVVEGLGKTDESVAKIERKSVASGVFVRLAGLMGALAVALAAYGAHVYIPGEKDKELVRVFSTGNLFHLLHSIALLGVSHTKRPLLVGSLMLTGMVIFSGTCYVHALTGSASIVRFTPYGGTLLIVAWLSLLI